MTTSFRRLLLVLPIVLVLSLSACGEDDGADTRSGSASGSGSGSGSGSASGSASGSGTEEAECEEVGDPDAADVTIEVTLADYEITLDESSVEAGSVAFHGTNEADMPHEIVVVAGVAADDLPMEDGTVDESQLPDGALIGEVEAFPGGTECAGAFDLEPGDYTVFCNVDDHAARGMVTELTVT
jgi:uncharacterized cupredoxin-like copper-binding protein